MTMIGAQMQCLWMHASCCLIAAWLCSMCSNRNILGEGACWKLYYASLTEQKASIPDKRERTPAGAMERLRSGWWAVGGRLDDLVIDLVPTALPLSTSQSKRTRRLDDLVTLPLSASQSKRTLRTGSRRNKRLAAWVRQTFFLNPSIVDRKFSYSTLTPG